MNPPPKLLYLSQTEANGWAGCHLQAWTRHVLGYRPPDDENVAQRTGNIGHAIVHERLLAAWYDRAPDDAAGVARETAKRRWTCDVSDEAERAAHGADALWRDPELNLAGAAILPDLYSTNAPDKGGLGGPFAECRVTVPWTYVALAYADADHDRFPFIADCPAVARRYAGMEGTPDLVMMPHGAGGPVVVVDYKFRQKPDLGGLIDDRAETIPNRQAAWYLVLLRAAGLRAAAGFEFWQANAFAGRRLTAEDFVRVAQGGALDAAEAGLVISSGLPTRDLDRIGQVGMVSADEWAEAHRILANIRHDRRMAEWRSTPTGTGASKRRTASAPPEMHTAAEFAGMQRFIADLRALPEVVVRKVPADPYVCRELVRDMIVGVEAPLALAMRGLTPARNLQAHRGSNCVRPYGCPIQSPCKATIGTWNIRTTLGDMHAAGMLARDEAAPPLGNHPSEANRRLLDIAEEALPLWSIERTDRIAGRYVQIQERDGLWRMVDAASMAILAEGDVYDDVRRDGEMAAERMSAADTC